MLKGSESEGTQRERTSFAESAARKFPADDQRKPALFRLIPDLQV